MLEEGPIRVLIADDEPLAVERLQLLLARSEGVPAGERARVALRGLPPGLAFVAVYPADGRPMEGEGMDGGARQSGPARQAAITVLH